MKLSYDDIMMLVDTPDCAVSLLREFADCEFRDVRAAIAENPNCPIPILKELAVDKDSYVRSRVAINPNCPIGKLEILSNDSAYYVRQMVAANRNCPLYLLIKLADDNDPYVRGSVAGNPNYSGDMLEKWANDDMHYAVRAGVARNPNCPVHLLEQLAQDEDRGVRDAVGYRKNCPSSVLDIFIATKQYYYVLSKPNCPVDILEKCAAHANKDIRAEVAANPNCPVPILKELANDRNVEVVEAVAGNPNTPGPLLEKLSRYGLYDNGVLYNATEGSYKVRMAVARNPNCSGPILDKMADDHAHDVRKALLKRIISNSDFSNDLLTVGYITEFYEPSIYLLRNPDCPVNLLERFVDSPSVVVRISLALHPNCPFHILDKLAHSKSKNVRYVVFHLTDYQKRLFEKQAKKGSFKTLGPQKKEEQTASYMDELKEKKEKLERLRQDITDDIAESRDMMVGALDKLATLDRGQKYSTVGVHRRINIPDEELYVKKTDDSGKTYYRIRAVYLPYIDYIDFSFVPDGLVVSDIDWSHTNISIDPQRVYRKDLTNGIFSDENFIWVDFSGCDLRGADISLETESVYSILSATTDETTKLPSMLNTSGGRGSI